MLRLYRFEPAEPKRIHTLEEGKLRYSSPRQFNDLEDCRLHLAVQPNDYHSDSAIKAAAEALYLPDHLPDGHVLKERTDFLARYIAMERRDLAGAPVEDFLKRVGNRFNARQLREDIVASTAVCCFFAAEPTDALMWAHYGNNHSGFCVEYELSANEKDLPEILHEVNYVSRWPPSVDAKELLLSPSSTLLRVVTTKRLNWAHEREFRIVMLNRLDPEGRESGIVEEKPPWLIPRRVICGARQKGDSKLNYDMETLAVRLGARRARIEVSDEGLVVADL